MAYLTNEGTKVALGDPIAEDEAASIHEIIGDSAHVAKIYRRGATERQAHKLEVLRKLSSEELVNRFAWPLRTLHPSANEPACGYIMPRVGGAISIADIYSPAHRRQKFPSADWRTLIQVAGQCAEAMALLHRHTVVMGDVSPRRFMIDPHLNVHLIGCDSLQIASGERCLFGAATTAEYAAPELQTAPHEAFPLTPNHDCFGLAVLVYRLLMMGKHPFAGYRGPNKLSIGDAIQGYRFVFGPTAPTLLMQPPPFGLRMSELPTALATTFQKAFTRGSEQDGVRPTAAQWVRALADLQRQTVACSRDAAHYYVESAGGCPWCCIEQDGGPRYFDTATQHLLPEHDSSESQHILAEFETITSPEHHFVNLKNAPLLPATSNPVSHRTRSFEQVVVALGVLTIGSALLMLLGLLSVNFLYIAATLTTCLAVGWTLAFFGSPLRRVRRVRKRTLAIKKAELAKVEREMASAVTRLMSEWTPRYNAAAAARDALLRFDADEASELKLLQATIKQRQLDEFLGHFYLRDLKMAKLSPSRLVILESFNVETARDITEAITSVPGLGKTLPSMLLAWRRTTESGCSYDTRRSVPAVELARIHNKHRAQREVLIDQLEVDCTKLAALSAAARREAGHFVVPLAACQSAVVQATADFQASR